MYNVKELNDFKKTLKVFFYWSRGLTVGKKIVFATGIACLTGLSAHFKVPLPWTPVPITLQTFFVLIAGVLLGRNWGGVSQIIYVAAGMLGFGCFAGGSIFGPTGGYLIGFVLSAFFLGYAIDKYLHSREFLSILSLMSFAGFFLIYIPGLIQLGFYLYLVKGAFPGFAALLSMGFFPFIPGDLIKITLATAFAAAILPKNENPLD
ncbi:biotin transporter BioY [candidate division WOR-3 bacterium]|nr:biotin transporter BioY [candidate division WOR-3 bacterium]